MFRIFKNEDSLIIFTLGVILLLLGTIVYLIEENMTTTLFIIGYGLAWIQLGLHLSKYKLLEEIQ